MKITDTTEQKIIHAAQKQLALASIEGFSMRALAKDVGIVQSVIYHYFDSKDVLLRAMFDQTNTELGKQRALLPLTQTVNEMLRQRIEFQLDHAQEIVAVLKYFLAYRQTFPKNGNGFVPDKTSLHIEEVLVRGITEGTFAKNVVYTQEARVITHAVNGFLLEFYPSMPKAREREEIISLITDFIWRAIPKEDTNV